MSEVERTEYASKEALTEFCAGMLRESNILEKMAQDNPTATKSFINMIKKLINKIRTFLKEHYFNTKEANILKKTADDLQAIVDKWEKAVIAGIKNQNAKMAVKDSDSRQKNNTFDGAEESNIQFQSRNSYPYNMQTVIQDYIDSVNDELLTFIQNVENGDRTFKRLNLSDVSDKQSKDIKNLLGIDVTGYKNAINTSGIEHIIKRHGKDGRQDHSMQNSKDIARMEYILSNYDNVELLKNGNGEIKTASGFVDKNNQNFPLIVFYKKLTSHTTL